jgi:hypothetical protein
MTEEQKQAIALIQSMEVLRANRSGGRRRRRQKPGRGRWASYSWGGSPTPKRCGGSPNG